MQVQELRAMFEQREALLVAEKEQQDAQVAELLSELQQRGLRQAEMLNREEQMTQEIETLKGEMRAVVIEAVSSQRTQEAQVFNHVHSEQPSEQLSSSADSGPKKSSAQSSQLPSNIRDMLANVQSFQGSECSCLHLDFLPHDAKACRTGMTNNGCKRVVMPLGDLHTVLSDNHAIAEHLVEKGIVLLDGEGKTPPLVLGE